MRWYPASATSETYELKITTFGNGKTEAFLALMKNFKTVIDGSGTTSVSIRINYIHVLCYM